MAPGIVAEDLLPTLEYKIYVIQPKPQWEVPAQLRHHKAQPWPWQPESQACLNWCWGEVQLLGVSQMVSANATNESSQRVEMPLGTNAPAQFYAHMARRHMEKYGTTSKQFAEVAITCVRKRDKK